MVMEGARHHESAERVMKGKVRARDRCGPRSTVCLEDITVKGDLALAERLKVTHRPQRAPDQPLDLVGATGLVSPCGLARDSLGRGAGEQGILSGHPALSRVLHPARRVLTHRSGAKHPGLTDNDQDRTARKLG